jgi:thiol-disulfide isomerase/thioredoxin
MSSFVKTPEELVSTMNNTKCLVLKFSAKWCGPCKNKQFLQSYHNLKDKYKKNSDVTFIEFDVDDDEQFVNDEQFSFNISSIPTIKIYHRGKLLNEYQGIGYLDNIDTDIKTTVNHL